MGGMGVESSAYAGGVLGPSVEAAFLDFMGSYTSSRPNSLFKVASLAVVSDSLGI